LSVHKFLKSNACDSASGKPKSFTKQRALAVERRCFVILVFAESLGTTMASVNYLIWATGLLIMRNSRHSAASITMLLRGSTKNSHFPALTRSGCELALFNEPPSG
jgi:hypothetical protein